MGEQMISILASKLDIYSGPAIKKAEEFWRLANLRAPSSLNISGSCQAVICLDLATNQLNLPFKKETAIKYSGLRRKLYINSLQTYMKVLEISFDKISVSDVTREFGCTQVTEMAEKVLNSYERVTAVSDSHQSMFAVAAVYVVCKKRKIKIGKRRLIDFGKVSTVMFDKLCLNLEKHVNCSTETIEKKKETKTGKTFLELVQENINNDMEKSAQLPKRKFDDDKTGYDYKEWKRRILSED